MEKRTCASVFHLMHRIASGPVSTIRSVSSKGLLSKLVIAVHGNSAANCGLRWLIATAQITLKIARKILRSACLPNPP